MDRSTQQERFRQVRALASQMLHWYYCDNDISSLTELFAPELTWFGVGEGQYAADGAAAQEAFRRLGAGQPVRCALAEEEYHVTEPSPGVYVCCGRLWLSADPATGLYLRVHQRLTLVFRREGERLTCVHIHCSDPYADMGRDERFPEQLGRESYDHIQRTLQKLEEEMSLKNQQMELVLSSIAGGLALCEARPPHDYLFVSEETAALFGYTVEEFLQASGGTMLGTIYPPDRERVTQKARQELAGGRASYAQKYRVVCRDGSLKWVLASGRRVRDQKGQWKLSVLYLDVTAAEREAEELRRQRELLGSIYDTVPCGILRLRREAEGYRLVSINAEGVRLLAFTSREQVPLDWGDGVASSVLREDRAVLLDSYKRLQKPGDRKVEKQILTFHNEREKARVGVYKQDIKTGAYLTGAVFNLYAADDIYNADGNLIFAAGDLIATSPETGAEGYTYFDVDVPIQGEYYGLTSIHIPTASGYNHQTNSGKYTIVEIRPPEGYFLNDTPMEVTFTYDGEVVQVLDSACKNEATSVTISKRELTGDDELPGATLTIQDREGNVVREWVSTDAPTEIRGLILGQIYTLIETRPADGYALASNIQFRLEQQEDEDGNPLNANDVYVLTGKDWLVFDHWTLMEDGMVVMRDDITRVQISKQDITNKQELPGAHLTITDENGRTVEEWTSGSTPHYIEKLPAGDYTLHEVSAPDGYAVAESVQFTVQPTGELQTVTMYDTPKTHEQERGILITKIDADTGNPLAGAEFQILDRHTKEVVKVQGSDGVCRDCYGVTNEAGNLWFTLPNGDYYFQEVKAPDGYQLNSTLWEFNISDAQTQRYFTFKNTKQPTRLTHFPQTGDNSPLLLFASIAVFALCGFAATYFVRKHSQGNLPAILQDDPDDDPENEQLDADWLE